MGVFRDTATGVIFCVCVKAAMSPNTGDLQDVFLLALAVTVLDSRYKTKTIDP